MSEQKSRHSEKRDRDMKEESRRENDDNYSDRKRHRSSKSRSPQRHSKHSHRDREKDSDRERDKKRDKEKDDRRREKGRDREREGERERDRYNRRSRSSSPSRRGKSSRHDRDVDSKHGVKELVPEKKVLTAEDLEKQREAQREAEQIQLELEMQKRRDRVKLWQEQKAKRLENEKQEVIDPIKGQVSSVTTENHDAKEVGKWSLEEEDEDELQTVTSDAVVPDLELPQRKEVAPTTVFDEAKLSLGRLNHSKIDLHIGVAEQSNQGTIIPGEPAITDIVQPKILLPTKISTVPSPATETASAKSTVGTTVAADSSKMEEDEEDPLDAFMCSLYSGADYDEAKGSVVDAVPLSSAKPTEKSKKSNEINQFGSNFITLEQIMNGGIVPADKESKRMATWESEAASSVVGDKLLHVNEEMEEDEYDAEKEAQEERDRQEFMTAMRSKLSDLDKSKPIVEPESETSKTAKVIPSNVPTEPKVEPKEVAAPPLPSTLPVKEEFGRIFAGEGDMIDETEVWAKKRSALEILEEQKRGKELRPIDHSHIQYIPIRKNLYIMPKLLSRLTPEEVQEKREDLQIKVRGKGCPVPVDNWEQCGLSERVLQVVDRLGLTSPFPIQKQAIPAIMCGRDVIGVAKTGSGKTLAFLLPMFRHILDQPPLGEGEGPIGLIMAPARELAFQIFNEAKKFSKALGLRVTCIYGGAGVAEQIADLKRGAEIVVCTPGRMIDILCMQAGKMVSLKRVSMVVMDEADRMFDMGFEPQIKMIIQNVRPDRQTVLFSATFPKQIEKLARSVLKIPVEIIVGERSTVNKDILQIVEVHEEEEKFMRLLQLLGIWYEKGSVLVFVDKQDKCDQLFHDLLRSGYPCLSLHGGKDQLDRDHTLYEFKTQVKTVMIATSVAGRGLDVPEIVVVINYNCPNHLEEYVHRVGRTGRAGRKGTAYTFISPTEDQYAPTMIKVLEKAGQPIPPELLALSDGFKDKVARGEANWGLSGFVGKGYTFDSSEMNETQKVASMQRKAYDLEQGVGDDEAEVVDDSDEEGDTNGVRARKLVEAGLVAPGLPITQVAPTVAAPVTTLDAAALAKLTPIDRARLLAASMSVNSTGAANTSSSGMVSQPVYPVAASSSGPLDPKAALAKARLIAQQMAGKANGVTMPDGAAPSGIEVMGHFSDEIEINDYPHQARRKVTQRQALEDIAERTGVNVISRGTFVPPGKKPELGERKLFLLLEGQSEMQVKFAKLEIMKALEEETIRTATAGSVGSFAGRYSVL